MKIRKTLCVIIAVILVSAAALAPAVSATVPVVTPVITSAPGNLQWPEDSLASYKCVCENDPQHDKFTYEWHIVYDGADYKVGSGFSDPWCAHVDTKSVNTKLAGNEIYLDGIKHGLNGAEIYCTVISSNSSVSTPPSTIFIIDEGRFTPPDITAPVFVECEQGDKVELNVKGTTTAGNVSLYRDYISYHWYSSEDGRVSDIVPIETGKDIYENGSLIIDTGKVGTYYYICGVFDGVDNQNMCNRSYSNAIMVSVLEKSAAPAVEPPTITVQPMGDELTTDEEVALIVEAKAPEGCTVRYQWHTSDKNGYAEMEPMEGEKAYVLKVPQTEGDRYYCCTVWSVDANGNMSTVVPSDIAKITYKKPAPAETTVQETETETEKVTETETETEPAPDTQKQTEPVNTDDLVPSGTETKPDGETDGAAQTAEGTETNAPTTTAAETEDTNKQNSASSSLITVLIIVAALLLCAVIAITVILIVMNKKKQAK